MSYLIVLYFLYFELSLLDDAEISESRGDFAANQPECLQQMNEYGGELLSTI